MVDIVQEGMKAVEEIRVAAKENGETSHEAKQIAENAQKAIDAMEAKNQELVAKMAEDRKAAEEVKERMDELELSVIEQSSKGVDYKKSEQYKALQAYALKGIDNLDSETKALLRTDSNTAGGYLTVDEMDSQILKEIIEISPIRQVARVRSTGSKTMEIVTRTSIPTANFEGEAEEDEESVSEYGNETLTCHALSATVPFTQDMLLNSAFDLESEIKQDITQSFAQAEGRAGVTGTGVKMPEGFLSNADLIAGASTSTGGSGVIDADDLILMSGELKVGYNPMYAFNRRTLAKFRTYKGSDGQYLWQAGLGGGAPNTIAGAPYVLMEDMPDIAANSLSVAYADFMRGYTITDFKGMMMIRDEVTRKRKRIIELTFFRWMHGQVVLPEAFQLLKTQA